MKMKRRPSKKVLRKSGSGKSKRGRRNFSKK